MVRAGWHFVELKPGEPERAPKDREFFRDYDLPEYLVREFVQNALDAQRENVVKVRFRFGLAQDKEIRPYLGGLEEHFRECVSKEQHSKYLQLLTYPVRFLVVEDFETTGLDGDTGDGVRRPEGSNFYDFWYREGMSRKTGRKGGRWGLGKTVFHMVSWLESFFGLTRRCDDGRELLMGKAQLKPHRMDDKAYNYFGYFRTDDGKPIESRGFVSEFKRRFCVKRNAGSGLSIVIPAVREIVTPQSVIPSIIAQYFYPIMRGLLVAEVQDGKNPPVVLNADNLLTIVCGGLDWGSTSWGNRSDAEIEKMLRFVQGAIRGNQRIRLFLDDERPQIVEESFGDALDDVRRRFDGGEIISFEIPITIRPERGNPAKTNFLLHFQRDPELRHSDEHYVRSGILVSDIKMRRLGSRPVRSLLVTEEETISKFLGDSENPGHTFWNERTPGFTDEYENACETLRFIKRSVGQIVAILDQPPVEPIPELLLEFFSLPVPEEAGKRIAEREEIFIPPKEPFPFEAGPIDGGFRVSLTEAGKKKLPVRARVRVAYNVWRGNPLKRYKRQDYDISKPPIKLDHAGCKIERVRDNQIELTVLGEDFELEVTGFDKKRDVYVRVDEMSAGGLEE